MAFKDLLEEMYAPMGGVSVRRMFGGLGIFKDGVMFGLGSHEDIYYLRADEQTAERFAAEQSTPFEYEMRGRLASMPFYRIPDRLWDDGEEFLAWSQVALDVALRLAAEKAKGKKPTAKKSSTAPKPVAKRPTAKPVAKRPATKAAVRDKPASKSPASKKR